MPEIRLKPKRYLMYLDTLPRDIFPTIVKHIFARIEKPCTPHRELGILSKSRTRINTLCMLVSDDSPFRDKLSQLSLAEIKLGRNTDATRLWKDSGQLSIGPELFGCESLELGIPERIFQLFGKSVTVVSFVVTPKHFIPTEADKEGVIQKFVKLVRRYCPNVENLSFTPQIFEPNRLPFEDIFPGLIEQFSSQLRSIAWRVNLSHKDYLCHPDISLCMNIQKLIFPSSTELLSFLGRYGASLEILYVTYGDIKRDAEMLDVIENNCTKLSTVVLRDLSRIIETIGEERYTNFLSSFGSQLVRAKIEGLSAGKLARVAKACPNLSIDIEYYKNEEVLDGWERISSLGPIIKHLSVAADVCRDEESEAAIARCSKLESLTIHRSDDYEEERIGNSADMNFLVSLSSTSLTSLHYFHFMPMKRNIDTLSLIFRNLRHLELRLVKSIEDGISFHSITQSNPRLSSVHIREWVDFSDRKKRGKHQSLEVLRMLVDAFSKCRSIHLVLLNDRNQDVTRDEIHNICGSLPCRGMHVEIMVGPIWYRQIE